jgi:hypothetical protein
MDLDGPRRGSRDNGLRCGAYAAIIDLDPRVADAVLGTLRDAGIAAYAAPAAGSTGGSMETRLPARPLDRLYVDETRVSEARRIVDRETDEPESTTAEPDFEASWQQVLASLQSTPAMLADPWPDRENLTLAEREAAYDEQQAAATPPEDEHYEPPPPPPLPRLRRATVTALLTMALCIFVMVTDIAGRGLDVLAFIVFVAAAASLIYNMRQGPPNDDGWDDGAVV